MKAILKDNTELQIKSATSINEIVLVPVTLEELNAIIPKISAENVSYVEFYNDTEKVGDTKKLKIKESGTIVVNPSGEKYEVKLSFDLKTDDELRFESLEDTVDKLVAQSLMGGM